MLGTRDNKGERPYIISYVHGERRLQDSAPTFEAAIARINLRRSKPHNRKERAEIWLNGELIHRT